MDVVVSVHVQLADWLEMVWTCPTHHLWLNSLVVVHLSSESLVSSAFPVILALALLAGLDEDDVVFWHWLI